MIAIERYGRHWAVYLNSQLWAATVYTKGAVAVKDMLERLAPPVSPFNCSVTEYWAIEGVHKTSPFFGLVGPLILAGFRWATPLFKNL